MAVAVSVHREDALARLRAVCGDQLITDEAARRFASQDVYRAGQLPLAVFRPLDIDSLARGIAAATEAGLAIFPRGGGMSYTDAYLPDRGDSIVVDMGAMNRVLSVSAVDLTATVEAGCTWADLDAALMPMGLRSVFWGPMSGRKATVGGSMSQGAVTYGSGRYGTSASAALGFAVVLAHGKILRTGSGDREGAVDFFRPYGPDLTGLFTADSGALGIKAHVTLQLEKRPAAGDGLAFAFADFDATMEACRAVAQAGLATETFGAEMELVRTTAGTQGLQQDLRMALAVAFSSRNPLVGLSRLAKIGLAGKRFLDRVGGININFLVEAKDDKRLRETLAELRDCVAPYEGVEIANSFVTITRATPFPEPMVLGPEGRRLLPMHGIVPYSRSAAMHADLLALRERHREKLLQHEAQLWFVYATLGASAILIEPLIYWKDSWLELHKATLPAGILSAMKESPENTRARDYVEALRIEIVDTMQAHGASHMQIGRAYPYLRGRGESASLVRALKRELDPRGLINPGALGL
jgi:D-lactate dehydrogenase (cytochrome)